MTKSYDGVPTRYLFTNINVGSSNQTRTILGPLDKDGLLWDYGVQTVTTTFAGGTSLPGMEIGNSGTLNAYGAAFTFTAMTSILGSQSIRTQFRPGQTNITPNFQTYISEASYGNDGALATTQADIPKNTIVYATMIAATGAGAAGVGDFFVDIIWGD